jgi:hypothetical protein
VRAVRPARELRTVGPALVVWTVFARSPRVVRMRTVAPARVAWKDNAPRARLVRVVRNAQTANVVWTAAVLPAIVAPMTIVLPVSAATPSDGRAESALVLPTAIAVPAAVARIPSV